MEAFSHNLSVSSPPVGFSTFSLGHLPSPAGSSHLTNLLPISKSVESAIPLPGADSESLSAPEGLNQIKAAFTL